MRGFGSPAPPGPESRLLARRTTISRETHVLTHPTSGHFGGLSSMARKSVLQGRKTVSQFPYPSCGPASWEHGGEEGGA